LAAAALQAGEYDLIIGCGGDGTINQIVNGMMRGRCCTPLAILPAGTVNDFAYSMKLPTDPEKFCDMVKTGHTRLVDLGLANNHYFVNVAAFGMFTDVAHRTSPDHKSVLGKFAYYLQGMREAQELFTSIKLQMVSEEKNIASGDFMICIISNTMSVGNMRRLMSKASVDDGMLDVLLIKRPQLPVPFRDLTSPGDFLDKLIYRGIEIDPSFIYFQTRKVEFHVLDEKTTDLDLDGEGHGSLPVAVEIVPAALRLMIDDPVYDKLDIQPLLPDAF